MRRNPATPDESYMDAVNQGRTSDARSMVDAAARQAGYVVGPVWHGTREQFTEFIADNGIHFGTLEQAEARLAETSWRGGRPDVRPYYLRGSFLRMPDVGDWDKPGRIARTMVRVGLLDKNSGDRIMAIAKRHPADAMAELFDEVRALGHDGFVYSNKVEGKGDSYMILDPSQAKLAEPVTTGDDGRVIPLSMRFDPGNPDLRNPRTPRRNPATPDALPGTTPGMLLDPAVASSPAFRRWFDGSVVVNWDGSPRVMYHGTFTRRIGRFRSSRVSGGEVAGWFAFHPEVADKFAIDPMNIESGTIYPVVLSVRRLFDVRNEEDQRAVGVVPPVTSEPGITDVQWNGMTVDERLRFVASASSAFLGTTKQGYAYDWNDLEQREAVTAMKRAGFDGYLDFEHTTNRPPTAIAVFDAGNVKSVFNKGTWDRRKGIMNPRTRRPAEFPFEWADALRRNHPSIWARGGNIRGNDTFRLWARRRRGERSPAIDRWWDVERPAWIARHFDDHRLPGVVAQIKWGAVGRLGVAGMKRVVEDAIGRGL